jgi:hypothetical protein
MLIEIFLGLIAMVLLWSQTGSLRLSLVGGFALGVLVGVWNTLEQIASILLKVNKNQVIAIQLQQQQQKKR